MPTSPAAEQLDTVPGTYQYVQEMVELVRHDRDMPTEAALRMVAALAEAEVRNAWPALADPVLIMVNLSNAGRFDGDDPVGPAARGRRALAPTQRPAAHDAQPQR
jgi:hypothetical protein